MKRITVWLVLALLVIVLGGCGTTAKAKVDENAGSSKETAPIVKITENADEVVVVDWSDRTLGESSIPAWLKDMSRGNSDTFKENWKVDASRVIKFSRAAAATEATAQALSRAGFAYTQAAELSQKVIGRVGQGLNDMGQLEALYVAASETKAEMTGLREEHGFCQKVRTTNNATKEVSEEYIYYTVYSMSKATWDALCKKYLMDVMGGADLTTETQKKIGALFSEMKEDADKKELKKAQEEAALYREQIARLEAQKGAIAPKQEINPQDAAVKKATEKAVQLESYLM